MKFLTFTVASLAVLPVAAHEMTSPFYVPEAGKFLFETQANYTKKKATGDIRQYRRFIKEDITVGFGAGWAASLSGQINWIKQKEVTSDSFAPTKTYQVGLQKLFEIDSFLMHFGARYHQTTNVHFEPRRQLETQVRLGKELKTMTPYVHGMGLFPLNARKDLNLPVYQGDVGVFQKVNDHMTLDSGLFLKYDKNIKERSYGVQAELSYLINSWAAISVNGLWQARGHAQNNTKTYCQSVGTNLRINF